MEETEITVQVFNSFKEINSILLNQGFKVEGNYLLNDWYFSKLENVKEISYLDLLNNSFLVRQVLTDKEKVQLCYKQKELDEFGNVIKEEKTSTNLDSLSDTIKIFKKSGLNNYCMVKNNTYIYVKDEIRFCVQVIENLGIFIEYEEDETMNNMNAKEKFNYMVSVVNSLKLKLGKDFSCKKVFMLLHKEDEKNIMCL